MVGIEGIGNLPIPFAGTFLLGLFGISIGIARLGKIAREMIFWSSTAVSQTSVITIVELVGTSHYRLMGQQLIGYGEMSLIGDGQEKSGSIEDCIFSQKDQVSHLLVAVFQVVS